MFGRLMDLFAGSPYDPLDLESHPRKGWIPMHDYASSPLGRNLLGFALRGAPVDNPDLDPRGIRWAAGHGSPGVISTRRIE